MEEVYRKVGKRIKKQRTHHGWTQEQLAEKAHIALQYLSRIERGVAKPTLDVLYNLASALACPIYQLLPPSNDVTVSAMENWLSGMNLSQEQLTILLEFLEWRNGTSST